MAEPRRLLIEYARICNFINDDLSLKLNLSEQHYLFNVLRLRTNDKIHIIDGEGKLWEAKLFGNKLIKFTTDVNNPWQNESKSKRSLCLAIAIPKIGFDDVVRMTCEIGIDIIQPLICDRSVLTHVSINKQNRWESILKESIEQSERLWKPEILTPLNFKNWSNNISPLNTFAIATTRIDSSLEIELWLKNLSSDSKKVWTLIGPEGGWSEDELEYAKSKRFYFVKMGDAILRTSTAAIAASQIMASWRKLST
ncbi:16S rRNA (uracil(1498)-N(3))-methyltransferase [Prochlorococcus marinus]|uniref:16S rRNA (uracil(1498)-N(3))-methyltransferase n=1 Tax=Prochlorococcus marinus TaxID=1219 RepID=UPI0022B40114|nr:16S rRNA (uracil(1498)-N(3))-methyltransferase [Prochlorococcus marinus]